MKTISSIRLRVGVALTLLAAMSSGLIACREGWGWPGAVSTRFFQL